MEPVTEAEIKRIVTKSKSTKPGPDDIPMSLLKNNIDLFCPVLTELCNKSLSAGHFPCVHKIGKIVPLFKSKDKCELFNYRPICLLNSISKILEKVMSNRLTLHFENNNIFVPNQFAYRKGKGTDIANVQFIKKVLEAFDKNQHTISVFLDLTKAFDCVDHEILLHKLNHYGIEGNSLNWIKSYLYDRRQFVYLNGKKSTERYINIGVPQGSILGPILFLVYINDLNQAVLSGDISLFADDANYYKSGNDCFQLINIVNYNLKQLSAWFLANRLSLNYIKSEAMLFSRRNIFFPLPPIVIDNIPISYSHSFKFLGLILDTKLNWKKHIQSVRSKLSSACGIFYIIRNKISVSIAKTIYYGIVYPFLIYCNIIWSSANISSLQTLCATQRKLVRLILKKGRRTESTALFNQLKFLKLKDIFTLSTSLFVYKTLNNLIDSPINYNIREAGAYNLRNRPHLQIPNHSSKQSERFLHIKGAKIWNDLPESIQRSSTIYSFKRNLKKYLFESYT